MKTASQKFIPNGALLLFMGSLAMILVLVLIPYVYPRLNYQQDEQAIEAHVIHRNTAPGGANGRRTTVNNQQRAMRQAINANTILYGTMDDLEKMKLRSRQAKGNGPWRYYEINRMLTQYHYAKYSKLLNEGKIRSPEAIASCSAFWYYAKQCAESKFSFYEDYYMMGLACLYHGKPRMAQRYLNMAEDQWPAQGNSYGFIYFYTMASYAINGQPVPLFQNLSGFEEIFPDWLYTERYHDTIKHLMQLYPDRHLLLYLLAYTQEKVNNDYEALKNYKKLQTLSNNSLTQEELVKCINRIKLKREAK